ncbi:MAG: class I SAM-dependent methyltransferase [Candidatus Caldarchaeum sp.]
MGLLEGLVAFRLALFCRELRDGLRVAVDVGCRLGWAGHMLAAVAGKPVKVVGLDVYEPYLRTLAEISKIYEPLRVDLETEPIPLPDGFSDLTLCIEVIEHLSKPAGYRLLDEMERITRKGGYIYLTTPNGWHGAKTERCVPLQHKSAWVVQDFLQRGYVVKGYGFRGLRGRGKLGKFYLLADYAWTPVARIVPQTGFGLEVYKKIW